MELQLKRFLNGFLIIYAVLLTKTTEGGCKIEILKEKKKFLIANKNF